MRVLVQILLLAAAVVGGGIPGPASSETPDPHILIVVPSRGMEAGSALADAIAAAGQPRPAVVAAQDYAPLIDMRAYDGFVFLGLDKRSPPKAGFVQDMRSLDKPLLWVGHHAGLLGEETLASLGLSLSGPPSGKYRLPSGRPAGAAVELVGTVRVSQPATASLLLSDGDGESAIGAAQSGGLTYAPIVPDFAPGTAGTDALVQLALDRFATLSGPARRQPAFADRIAEARADDFAAAVHLPVYVSESHISEIHGPLDGYDSDNLHSHLVRLRDAGAEWVVIQRIFYQNGVFATEIFRDPQRTATLESLANIVSDAHKLGLKVRLVPVVNLTEKSVRPGDWRGMIAPGDPATGEGRHLWWARYREILLEDAAFAREHEVEALDIGAEMSALLGEADQWRSLAADVRDGVGYRGLIGYQVNFDVMTDISWDDAIDYLAVAAYWPLSETPFPEVADLVAAWDEIWAEVAPWVRERPELRVEFGEIGYAAQPYASVYPYTAAPDEQGRLDVTEQLSCYLALEQHLARHPEIRGVGIFASTRNDVDPASTGYSPFAKPAAAVVRRILAR